MTYVLTVFIDALKPESLKYMPFLQSFAEKRRVKTELGYSTTCHPSMYSGIYPNKHLIWFIWRYSPDTSPFKWISNLKIDRLPSNIYIRYLYHQVSSLLNRKEISSFFGIPFLWNIPLQNWQYFDVAEKRFWTEPQYLESYPTIFDILRENDIGYDVVGIPTTYGGPWATKDPAKEIQQFNPHEIKPWTFLWTGDLDNVSHLYGQDSNKGQLRLAELDRIVEQKYKFFQERVKDFVFMLYSDHGHIKVEGEVDLCSVFESAGKRLDDYIFFIDSSYARFWFRTETEKKEIVEVLARLDDKGFILTKELQKKYNIDMPDNRYGDLIFYLDAPYVLSKGEVFILGKKRNPSWASMHGYLPDHQDSDGVLVSNKPLIDDSHVYLQDIVPSLLTLLDIPIPKHVDGKVIWR